MLDEHLGREVIQDLIQPPQDKSFGPAIGGVPPPNLVVRLPHDNRGIDVGEDAPDGLISRHRRDDRPSLNTDYECVFVIEDQAFSRALGLELVHRFRNLRSGRLVELDASASESGRRVTRPTELTRPLHVALTLTFVLGKQAIKGRPKASIDFSARVARSRQVGTEVAGTNPSDAHAAPPSVSELVPLVSTLRMDPMVISMPST